MNPNKLLGPSQDGFTLLEVIMAMVILASGIVIVTTAWSNNLLRVRNTNIYSNVAYLLEKKMVEIETKYKDRPLEEIPEQEDGEFEGYENYKWSMKSREFELPSMGNMVEGGDTAPDETTLTLLNQVSDYMKKAVKEVRVNVSVTVGKRKLEYSAARFFVNYDTELSLPGLPGGDQQENQQNQPGTDTGTGTGTNGNGAGQGTGGQGTGGGTNGGGTSP